MSPFAALLAVTLAFPKGGMQLPYVTQCYAIGAVERGTTNVTVCGKDCQVYRTGAWAAVVPVAEGANTLTVSCVENGVTCSTSVTFRVAAKPKPPAADAPPVPPKTYKKLAYAGDEARAHPTGRSPGEMTVIVDPGHGGSDTGAVSPHGWFEKEVNLLLASEVAAELRKLGYRAKMTRVSDEAVGLYDRPKAIYAEKADAFVSIHHNAPAADRDAGAVRYAAVYSWNPLGEALAKAIARRMDAVQRAELPSNGALHANFAVTRNPEVPSCLVEADFITNPAGEEAAWDAAKRSRLAAAIAAGIADWHAGGGSVTAAPMQGK